MKPFLQEVVEDLILRFSHNWSKIAIVFPNQRARLFFRKYYSQASKKTSWSPTTYTLNQFVGKLIRLKTTDRLSTLLELYRIYKTIATEQIFTFDRFYYLGDTILNDLEELDKYLVDIDLICANLHAIERIEDWAKHLNREEKQVLEMFWGHFSENKLSPEKEKFLQLWTILPELYKRLNQHLEQHGLAREGYRHKLMSRKIDQNQLDLRAYDTIVFIAFNALTASEKKLFDHLQDQQKALFYWDMDAYYMENTIQEAGFFLRQNLKRYGRNTANLNLPNLLNTANKTIEITGYGSDVEQAKQVSSLLSNYLGENIKSIDSEKVAIVLPDAHLLFPVLHALPEGIEKINVTMGYPFTATALYGLLEQYLNMQSGILTANPMQTNYYYKDIIALLRHPAIWHRVEKEVKQQIKQWENRQMLYLSAQIFADSSNDLLKRLFLPAENGQYLLNNLLDLLFLLFTYGRSMSRQHNSLEDEYIYQVYVALKRLNEVLNKKLDEALSVELAIQLIRHLIKDLKIPFDGEPVEGIQLIDLDKTHSLDFEYVIILSVNEGILPGGGSRQSFISESLRQTFGLPVIKHHAAIEAYYFYRLLQRAEHITLLYKTIASEDNGEISRFVQQIERESRLKIDRQEYFPQVVLPKKRDIYIEKSEAIMTVLEDFVVKDQNVKRRFSASAINTYLKCHLQFYFKYIVQLSEKQELEERIDAAVFGSLLHKTLENIYTTFAKVHQQHLLKSDDFKHLRTQIEPALNAAFCEHYHGKPCKKFNFQGHQLLVKAVIAKYTQTVLDTDALYAPFEIIELEARKTNGVIQIQNEDRVFSVGLMGIIDRIDKKGNLYRVVDYKTGEIEKTFKEVEDLFDIERSKRNEAVLQIIFYTMLFRAGLPLEDNTVLPAFYDVRDMTKENFEAGLILQKGRQKTALTPEDFSSLIPEYKDHLRDCLIEIFNPAIPFTKRENKQTCEYCQYSQLCNCTI